MINLARGVLIGLVMGALSTFFFARNYYRASAEIARLTEVTRILSRDLAHQVAAEKLAAGQAAALEAQASALRSEIDDIEKELQAETGVCRLDASGLERLRRAGRD